MQTIAAIATPQGIGGVGIIRISGTKAFDIATTLTQKKPHEKKITYASFYDEKKNVIDSGLILAFKNPHSFTGEDVIECQVHGGPVVMSLLLDRIVQLGARLAEPGEFSKRAFLNDKIDLLQAEAIADLIEAQSTHAARLAQHSLQGVFSREVNQLVENLIQYRTYIEAALDFPEEEIDFIGEDKVKKGLSALQKELDVILQKANDGALLRDGIDIVICGKPNAGKSTLMNQLSGEETAIVTSKPGTTRDILREKINLDGMILHLSDTAGLRETEDEIEKEGVRRAEKAIEKSTLVLYVVDGSDESNDGLALNDIKKQYGKSVLLVINKSDLFESSKKKIMDAIYLSAKEGLGIEALKKAIKQKVGLLNINEENAYLARKRHLIQLERAQYALLKGQAELEMQQAGELLAENLRLAQEALSEITGAFSPDDLLGEIFSNFCIGK